MAALGRNFCSGCLNAGRRMVFVDDYCERHCFLQIISDIPMLQPDDMTLSLCWECAGLLRRFTKFQLQVQNSYKTLLDVGEQNLSFQSQISNLTIHKQFNIDSTEMEPFITGPANLDINDISQTLSVEEIKEEIHKENPIKLELESHSENDHDVDIVINHVTQKKRKNNTKKKKKKEVEIFKEVLLTDKDLEEERKEMELRDEYVNAMFRCEKCLISFPNADDLKDHVTMKHELNAAHHKCPICTCSFVSEISYNYHANKHRRRYECGACAVRLKSKRAAEKHYENTHVIGPSFENGTLENVVAEDTLKTDAKDVTIKSESTFPCELCAKTFRWKTSLRKHLETHRIEAGQKRRPYCEPCKLSFTTTSNLQKHVKTSSKHQIQLKLRKLNESLPQDSTTPEKHRAHIEEIKCSVNSARQQYPCPHCGARFQWRGNLLRHLHSHAARATGSLVCAPCARTFSSAATYKQHMLVSRKHVTEHELRHVCPECGRRFANKTRLSDHVDWEHKRLFRHACDLCQKVFKSHTSLYLHKQVVHKKDNAEHLCDHCGKPFPNHAKLRSHIIALHTSEAPYKCGSCNARFSWHSCLSRHVRRVHKIIEKVK